MNLAKLDPFGEEICEIRGAEIAMIFQEPMRAFSPVHTIGNQITEGILLRSTQDRQKAYEIALEMLRRVQESMALVGLGARYVKRYPHAFSGGRQQRIAGARPLATNPGFIVCDEPVSTLDVSARSQILNLLLQLQERSDLSYLFISHDLSVVRHISHRAG